MLMCKARRAGCLEEHSSHYCRLCEDTDSDHLSRDCPSGTLLFHGTTAHAARSITEEGLKCSSDGCWGKGIYFVEDRDLAVKIAKLRQNQRNEGWAVLECMVNLGRICDWTRRPRHEFDLRRFRNSGFNSIEGTHPAWAAAEINNEFTEYCLKDDRKCNVVGKILDRGRFVVIGGNSYTMSESGEAGFEEDDYEEDDLGEDEYLLDSIFAKLAEALAALVLAVLD